MLIDLKNQAVCVNAFPCTNLAASGQGTFQDFSNGHIAIQAVIDVGVYGANTTNVQVQIEESSTTNSGWTAINAVGGGTMVQSGITTAGQYILKGLRQHRYARANVISVQGTTASVYLNVDLFDERLFAGSGGGYSRSPST